MTSDLEHIRKVRHIIRFGVDKAYVTFSSKEDYDAVMKATRNKKYEETINDTVVSLRIAP